MDLRLGIFLKIPSEIDVAAGLLTTLADTECCCLVLQIDEWVLGLLTLGGHYDKESGWR